MRTLIFALCLLPSLCLAEDPRRGDKVVVITKDAQIHSEPDPTSKSVDQGSIGLTLIIRDTRGDWLDVNFQYPGWIRRADVVPLTAAVVHFTEKMNQDDEYDSYVVSRFARAVAWRERNETDIAIKEFTELIEDLSEDSTDFDEGNDYLAQIYLERAIAWIDQYEFDKSIDDLNEAIRLRPSNPVAFLERGYARIMKERDDQALRDLNEAIQLAPNFVEAYLLRGSLREFHRQFDQALADYEKGIEIDSKFSRAHTDKASVHRQRQQFKQALQAHRRAIELDPQDPTAYVERALTRLDMDELDKALEDCATAIRLEPGFEEAYATRAALYSHHGEYETAITDLNKAIELAPKYAETYVQRGCVWAEKKEPRIAIQDYTEAIRLKPQLAFAYKKRADAWKTLNENQKALADYAAAIRLDATLIDAYLQRGQLLEAQQALDNFSAVLRLDPDNLPALLARGHLHGNAAKFESAVADYQRIIAIDPAHVEVLRTLAWIQATCNQDKLRDGAAAVKHALRACELTDHKEPLLMQILAAAYAEQGDFKKAVEIEERAIELMGDPGPSFQANRLELYRQGKPYRVQQRAFRTHSGIF